METEDERKYPRFARSGGALARVLVALVTLATYSLKQFARARAHRRDAACSPASTATC